ncbi:glycosyltransferase [Kroppenstedtia pulmonis]|uniref:Glycosyltransferase n=1 Tax=Kroppenstedtia pulmonis TaxID=1380685 RepID=A0A7D3Y0Y2_9BACL|nr:glycosyltransferase [Kroppenstedtia pulmonis]QKG84860.1 glycosyltransferase [Kroppenstedtia pulmonis]
MDKIVILTETIGGNGHYQAAKALKKGLNQVEPSLDITISCGLPQFSSQLESLVRWGYLNTLQFAPGLWGAAYSREEELSHAFRSTLGNMLAGKIKKHLDEIRPQVVICTHAFCLSAAGTVKEQSPYSFQLGAAITDFDVNGFWFHPSVDFYLVAHEFLSKKLQNKYHVAAKQIYETGIPIDPAFSESYGDKKIIRRALGLQEEPFTLLLMGGGVGLGPLAQVMEQLKKKQSDLQLVAVTGKNEGLLNRLKNRFDKEPDVHVLGYVEGMADWMRASDLIVSKPGGLTSSEALATGLPLLICRPIPGQEERNSQFLTKHRVAFRQDQPRSIPRLIHPLVQDHHRIEKMSNRAKQLGKPSSSLDAAQIVLDHLR